MRSLGTDTSHGSSAPAVQIAIYVAQHCPVCAYAYEVADWIRARYPQVQIRLVDMATTEEEIPEVVFATPTYLLNGRVWSLGNPSHEQITTTLHDLAA
jgi:hypothetical protein